MFESGRTIAVAVAVAVAVGCAALAVVPARPAAAAVAPPPPFSSWVAFVDRQHQDLLAAPPTAAQRASAVERLEQGKVTPGGYVAELRLSDDQLKNVDPTVRLYRAYFLRIPDRTGLEYWIARRRTGDWTLERMSSQFAASSEFTARYGSLTNRQFVQLIYDNVLQRPSDPGGLDYWTRQLDQKRRTRGSVMVGFSESGEYRAKQAAEVHVSVLYLALLRRPPTTAEFGEWVGALESGAGAAALATHLLGSAAYRDRFPAPASIAAGRLHTCALVLDTNRTVRCWGSNGAGQLGDGTTTRRLAPVAVGGLTGAVEIAASEGNSSCARLASGAVRCWGAGPLGNGSGNGSPTPVTVPGIANASQLALGLVHACALLSDGTARCWGDNRYGQLGDGTDDDRYTPVPVSGLRGAVQIASGSHHTCALLSSGTVTCWGGNDRGQLGNGTISPVTLEHPLPRPVEGLSGVVRIGAGSKHTCALLAGGTARCWGSNGDRQLGDGTTTDRSRPVTVAGLQHATQLVGGAFYSCAKIVTGTQPVPSRTAQCWGSNRAAQLGDGTVTDRAAPTSVVGVDGVGQLSGVDQLTASITHTCARLTDGGVRCWGGNLDGQVGDGTTTLRRSPVVVTL